MAIDQFVLEPMLSPYKTMIDDVEARGLDNEHVVELKKAYARIQQLGQEHSDITAFTGQCMQEDLYTQLSNHYSSALSAGSNNEVNPEEYDDSGLLKQSVAALKNAISEIKRGKEEALAEASEDPKEGLDEKAAFAHRFAEEQGINMQGMSSSELADEMSDEIDAAIAKAPAAFDSTAEVEALDITGDIIPAIENLIALGEQEGMTLPKFLRLQIEQGLDKAMEGAVATRKGLDYELGWAHASALSPHHIKQAEDKIQLFDDLAGKQKFGVPNWKELQWANHDLERTFVMDIAKWQQISDRWNSIIDDLSFWALAHMSFAEYVEPWKLMPRSQRRPSIEATKWTQPGIIKEKERLLQKYFGISFEQIFDHPTFQWEVEKKFVGWSREYVDFLRNEVYPACIPCELLPAELITKKEELYKGKREANPEGHYPAVRVQEFYDQKFGEGRHLAKFGPITAVESNAAPW